MAVVLMLFTKGSVNLSESALIFDLVLCVYLLCNVIGMLFIIGKVKMGLRCLKQLHVVYQNMKRFTEKLS